MEKQSYKGNIYIYSQNKGSAKLLIFCLGLKTVSIPLQIS